MTEPETVLIARRVMVEGKGMKQAAQALCIIPSSRLDQMLWRYIDVASEDLPAREFVRNPVRTEFDF